MQSAKIDQFFFLSTSEDHQHIFVHQESGDRSLHNLHSLKFFILNCLGWHVIYVFNNQNTWRGSIRVLCMKTFALFSIHFFDRGAYLLSKMSIHCKFLGNLPPQNYFPLILRNSGYCEPGKINANIFYQCT